jgi:hypothetical protein
MDALHDWLDVALAFAAVATVFIAVSRWSNHRLERKIVATIVASTAQIKTDTNGGQSLNDVNLKVNELQEAHEAAEHKRDMQHQEIKYELAAIKRIASYPAEGEE